MILSYRDEIDLSLTKYGDGWRSPYLAGNPDYTEEMQRFDRWCRRRYELGRRQELNEAYKQSNDKERRRRSELNDSLDHRISDVLGDEYTGEKVFGDGAVNFTNEGFDPDWMDTELIDHGLPVIELMKEWLSLIAAADVRNEREKLEEEIQAEYILEYIKRYAEQKRRLKGNSDTRQKKRKRNLKSSYRTVLNKGNRRLYWLKK